MMTSRTNPFHVAAIVLTTLALVLTVPAGCERDTTTLQAGTSAAMLPAGFFLEQEPEGILSVAEAKQAAKEGDRVVVYGRIGGTRYPFVNGRAVMTIVDMALPTCADRPDDLCETPWDYCCEVRSDIVAHAATIQISAETGGALRADLKGANGLQPMSEVIVVGRVGQTSSPTAFMVEAENIYVRR